MKNFPKTISRNLKKLSAFALMFLGVSAVIIALTSNQSLSAQIAAEQFCHHCVEPKVETQIAAVHCSEAMATIEYLYSIGFTQSQMFMRASTASDPQELICDIVAIKLLP